MDGYEGKNAEFFINKRNQPKTVGDFIGRPAALELANLKSGEIVIDAGCGTGYMTRQFAKITGPNCVFGCDCAPSMIAAADQDEKDAPLGIQYSLASIINKMPYESNYADKIICVAVFMHMCLVGINCFLREAYRILKPGGSLVISYNHPRLYDPNDGYRNWIRFEPVCDNGGKNRFMEFYANSDGAVLQVRVTNHPSEDVELAIRRSGLRIIRKQDIYVTRDVLSLSQYWSNDAAGYPAFLQFLAQKPL